MSQDEYDFEQDSNKLSSFDGLLKIGAGESVTVWIHGPTEKYTEYFQGDSKTSEKAIIGVYHVESNEHKAMKLGKKLRDQLVALNRSMPFGKFLVKISRTGSGKNDTTYFPMPMGEITQAVRDKAAQAKNGAKPYGYVKDLASSLSKIADERFAKRNESGSPAQAQPAQSLAQGMGADGDDSPF